jgi:hypothetical protein
MADIHTDVRRCCGVSDAEKYRVLLEHNDQWGKDIPFSLHLHYRDTVRVVWYGFHQSRQDPR